MMTNYLPFFLRVLRDNVFVFVDNKIGSTAMSPSTLPRANLSGTVPLKQFVAI